ncbi:MAG: hypothetical protein H7Z40_05885 [Phycisphaerae bacterium]|nr:hypothetical protein [Gemmatimonadaceae bacterium]
MVDFEEFRQTVEGQVCLDLVAQECWYRGELVESLNVLYLRFAETGWARLGIDAGDFH